MLDVDKYDCIKEMRDVSRVSSHLNYIVSTVNNRCIAFSFSLNISMAFT